MLVPHLVCTGNVSSKSVWIANAAVVTQSELQMIQMFAIRFANLSVVDQDVEITKLTSTKER
jgi:hypothetical protein